MAGRRCFSSKPLTFETTEVLPFNQQHFYNTIIDVPSYSEFVPFMYSSKVVSRISDRQFTAVTDIGVANIKDSYTSIVTHEEPELVIVEAEDALIFKKLYSEWKILHLEPNKCQLSYKVELHFGNPMYAYITQQFLAHLVKHER